MEDYLDFTANKSTLRFYGGTSSKKGVLIDGKAYMLKMPSNPNDINSNSALTEYIGSHIYELLDIPVQKTCLGIYKEDKTYIAVACEDFNKGIGDKFVSFREIMTTFIPHFTDSNGIVSNGDSSDLQETLLTIEQHPVFEGMRDVIKTRFWEMFIVDCLIANPSRNNGNWGLIQHLDDTFSPAPVLGNEGCLNINYNQTCSYLEKGKRINPSQFIERQENRECTKIFLKLYPEIERTIPEILSFLDDVPETISGLPCCTKVQKEYFKSMINYRFSHTFRRIYTNLTKEA